MALGRWRTTALGRNCRSLRMGVLLKLQSMRPPPGQRRGSAWALHEKHCCPECPSLISLASEPLESVLPHGRQQKTLVKGPVLKVNWKSCLTFKNFSLSLFFLSSRIFVSSPLTSYNPPRDHRTEVFNLWVTTLSLGSPKTPCISEIYIQLITVELQFWSSKENDFVVGVNTTRGAVLEGRSIREVENHCHSRMSGKEAAVPNGYSFVNVVGTVQEARLAQAWEGASWKD